jgi:hypothetical protein
VDPAIKTDADDGALGVFDLMHGDWRGRFKATGREARGKHDVSGPE